jgi:hypothetical protein
MFLLTVFLIHNAVCVFLSHCFTESASEITLLLYSLITENSEGIFKTF